MNMTKPMSVVLIEDEVAECIQFKDCANNRSDIKFVGMTDSAEEGLKLVQSHLPEAVILDLQLSKGSGSGIGFLEALNESELAFRPIVMVTTTNVSRVVRDSIEDLGADWYYCKKQQDYSAGLVFDTLLSLRKHLKTNKPFDGPAPKFIESPEEKRIRIFKRIDAELDLIGIRARFKGRGYLRDGIYLQMQSGEESVIDKVAALYKHAYNTISVGMQTSINDAWENAAPGELEEHYTARISAKTGTPTPTDFIYHYAEKIKQSI